MNIHVLYRKAPHSHRTSPVLNHSPEMEDATGKNFELGIVLFNSTQADRDEVLNAHVNLVDADDGTEFHWIEMTTKI